MRWMEQLEDMESSLETNIEKNTEKNIDIDEKIQQIQTIDEWHDLLNECICSYDVIMELIGVGIYESLAAEIVTERLNKLLTIGKENFNLPEDIINNIVQKIQNLSNPSKKEEFEEQSKKI